MTLLQLEPRDVPATDVGLGDVLLAPGVYRHAFEDSWTGHLNLYDTGELVYVGAGHGGGPRVQVYDKAGQLHQDFFAGDPASRAGVFFVPTDPVTREVVQEVVREVLIDHPVPYPVEVVREVIREVQVELPSITVGDTGDPSAYRVYVDWESYPEWAEAGMARLAASLPVAGLVFTTVRPDDWPGAYGAAVVTAGLDYADAQYGSSVAGLGFANWTDRVNLGVNEFVQVGTEHSTEELIGDLLAHEIAHGFGWSHGDDGDFRDDLGVILHGVELAKKFLIEVR